MLALTFECDEHPCNGEARAARNADRMPRDDERLERLSTSTIDERARRSAHIDQKFFTGGARPGDDLLLYLLRDSSTTRPLRVGGRDCARSVGTWLANSDRGIDAIAEVRPSVRGAGRPLASVDNRRVFFMACAEPRGFRGGQEWSVSHCLFERRTTPKTP